MTVISFPSECERSILAGRGIIPAGKRRSATGLLELMRSDENFLSTLEAIHYLSFPDW
jgi:hypothetical protein